MASVLESWSIDPDDAVLLTDELATNAVLHARSPFAVTVLVQPPVVRVEVADANVRMPVMIPAVPDAFSGRGLSLVDAVADRWGMEPTTHGKLVWFELAPGSSET